MDVGAGVFIVSVDVCEFELAQVVEGEGYFRLVRGEIYLFFLKPWVVERVWGACLAAKAKSRLVLQPGGHHEGEFFFEGGEDFFGMFEGFVEDGFCRGEGVLCRVLYGG